MISIFATSKHMEFNILPNVRVSLPKSRATSGSTSKANTKSNQTANQTVNVIIPPKQDGEEQSVSISTQQQPIQPEPEPEAEVHYKTRDVQLEEPAEQLTQADSIATINFLKLVLESYMNNPIKYNDFIICSVPVLEQLIETITKCDDSSIDLPDIEAGCCGTHLKNIVPISKIWVRNGDSSEIFKYKYSNLLQVFEQYHISLKFVFVDQ